MDCRQGVGRDRRSWGRGGAQAGYRMATCQEATHEREGTYASRNTRRAPCPCCYRDDGSRNVHGRSRYRSAHGPDPRGYRAENAAVRMGMGSGKPLLTNRAPGRFYPGGDGVCAWKHEWERPKFARRCKNAARSGSGFCSRHRREAYRGVIAAIEKHARNPSPGDFKRELLRLSLASWLSIRATARLIP